MRLGPSPIYYLILTGVMVSEVQSLIAKIQVCMGCKEPEACIANKNQNFVGSWKSWQCRPWSWTKV